MHWILTRYVGGLRLQSGSTPTVRCFTTCVCYVAHHTPPGHLVGLSALGNKILVLNSHKAINDLLDKRGGIYSDRPVFTAGGELMGMDKVRKYSAPFELYIHLAIVAEHDITAVRRRMADLSQIRAYCARPGCCAPI